MSRLADAILNGGYSRDIDRPMLDLKFGGQHGWAPNLTEYISNQAYVSRPLICLLVEPPRMFKVMPDSQKWIASLKALFELHARTIDGMSAGLKTDFDEHPVGGAGEMQQELVNITRERSQPKFTFIEKYGRPIQTLLDYWLRYGGMDPETKYALLGTMGKSEVKDMLADWYTATCIFIVPDPLHKTVDKAWLTTNMMPQGTGEITAKRDLTTSQEMLTLDIEFTGISQVGMGVNKFAQDLLNKMSIQNADPFMRSAFTNKIAADVDAVNTVGYKAGTEQLAKSAVTTMG